MDNQDPRNQNNQPGWQNDPQYTYTEYNNTTPTYGLNGDVPGKGKATASLVLGILSLVMAWMGWFSVLGFVLAVVGIVMASSARRTMPYGTAGRATAGMVLCVIAIIVSIAAFLISMFFWNNYGGYWDYYNYYWY